MNMPHGISLSDARKILKERMADGAVCPCCDQFAKRYKRKLNSCMAVALISAEKTWFKTKEQWLHTTKIAVSSKAAALAFRGGEFAKLRHWGLIEEMPKDPSKTESRTSGYWRITEQGFDFVYGKILVPRHIFTYAGNVIGIAETETTSIQQALGDKFNYFEMMGDRAFTGRPKQNAHQQNLFS